MDDLARVLAPRASTPGWWAVRNNGVVITVQLITTDAFRTPARAVHAAKRVARAIMREGYALVNFAAFGSLGPVEDRVAARWRGTMDACFWPVDDLRCEHTVVALA